MSSLPPMPPDGAGHLEEILVRLERSTATGLEAIRAEVGAVAARVTTLHERVLGGAQDGTRPLMIRVEDLERRLDATDKALRFLLTSAIGSLVTTGVGALVAWLLMR
jgi:hypothetical protein